MRYVDCCVFVFDLFAAGKDRRVQPSEASVCALIVVMTPRHENHLALSVAQSILKSNTAVLFKLSTPCCCRNNGTWWVISRLTFLFHKSELLKATL